MAAKKKTSPKKASPKKASPSKTPVIKMVDLSMYTKFQQECINKAENIVKELKEKRKAGDRSHKHVAHLVADAYAKASKDFIECADFYAEEKVKKTAAREARKASKPQKRSRSKSKSKGKKSPQKGGSYEGDYACGECTGCKN